MVTLEPVSFDGVWPTFGRLGSAAMRGSGLPGSALSGLSGVVAPGLPGPPGFGDGQAVEPGRAVGVTVGFADALAVGVADGVAVFSLRPPVNRSPIPSRMSVMMLPSRSGLALGVGVGVPVGVVGLGDGVTERDGLGQAVAAGRVGAACTALGWVARPAAARPSTSSATPNTRGSAERPGHSGGAPASVAPPAGRSTRSSAASACTTPIRSVSSRSTRSAPCRAARLRSARRGPDPRPPDPRQADPPPPGPHRPGRRGAVRRRTGPCRTGRCRTGRRRLARVGSGSRRTRARCRRCRAAGRRRSRRG